MIEIKNGWAQWDAQIGTFRAEIDGVVYGTFTGSMPTASDLSDALPSPLTSKQIIALSEEKVGE